MLGATTVPITAHFKASWIADQDYALTVRGCYEVPLEAVGLDIGARMNLDIFGRGSPPAEVRRLLAAVRDPFGLEFPERPASRDHERPDGGAGTGRIDRTQVAADACDFGFVTGIPRRQR